MPIPNRPLSKILLASALTFAIHSTLHAATDIESGTNGTGQDASATVTSSDPANTITATGGSGAPNSNGGNATASATLTPNTDSNSSLSATGGNGGDSTTLTLAGNGGNATISPLTISTTTSNITLTALAKGGNGGNESLSNTSAGNGGTATVNPISLSSLSGNITANITQTSGNGGTIPAAINGIAPDSILNNALSASTTGNITLTQSATAGNGSSGGNASSSLTLTNTTAASLTATAKATGGSNGSGTASINLTGITNVLATATAFSGAGPASASATTNTAFIGSFANSTSYAGYTGSAIALTRSLGNATATTNGSNLFYTSFTSYASGTNAPGTQNVQASFNQAFPSLSQPNTFAIPVFTNFDINNGTGPTRIDDQLLHIVLLTSNSSANGTQSHTAGFQGTLDTSLFTPEELILSGGDFSIAGGANFDTLHFRFWLDNTVEIDQTFTSTTAFDQFFSGSKDFGSMSSFGPGPLTIQMQMDTTTHTLGQTVAVDFILNNQAPATPEPASLSLLTAATLPLLLKRRRLNKLNTEQP